MADTFLEFDPDALAGLPADEAVRVFRMLLWCAVRRFEVPLNSVTVSARVNVPDGGVDAESHLTRFPRARTCLPRETRRFKLRRVEVPSPGRRTGSARNYRR